jgi:recombinational DNA repair ATPase RecF
MRTIHPREVVLMTLESAISDLQETVAGSRSASNWRWLVRQRLSVLRQALDDSVPTWDGWLAPRGGAMERERRQLLARISAVGAGLLDRLESERVSAEITRVLNDVEHYRQRLHDLVYDSVAMEIGGSE